MKVTKEDITFLTALHDNIITSSKEPESEQEKEELQTMANRLNYIQVDIVENDSDSDFQKLLKARIELG